MLQLLPVEILLESLVDLRREGESVVEEKRPEAGACKGREAFVPKLVHFIA